MEGRQGWGWGGRSDVSPRRAEASSQHGSRLSPKETDQDSQTEAGRLLGLQPGKSQDHVYPVLLLRAHAGETEFKGLQEQKASRAGKPELVIKKLQTGGRRRPRPPPPVGAPRSVCGPEDQGHFDGSRSFSTRTQRKSSHKTSHSRSPGRGEGAAVSDGWSSSLRKGLPSQPLSSYQFTTYFFLRGMVTPLSELEFREVIRPRWRHRDSNPDLSHVQSWAATPLNQAAAHPTALNHRKAVFKKDEIWISQLY